LLVGVAPRLGRRPQRPRVPSYSMQQRGHGDFVARPAPSVVMRGDVSCVQPAATLRDVVSPDSAVIEPTPNRVTQPRQLASQIYGRGVHSPNTLNDATLLAAQNGDQNALNILYRELSPRVLGYLLGKGVSDAEAATSEVFLAVFTRLERITGGVAGLQTLVFSIAHARMVDETRQRSRKPEEREYLVEFDDRRTTSAEQQALYNDEEAQVRRLLAALPTDQAEVLRLRILADLSIEQAAEVMGRSAGAVKQLQRRALIALRATVSRDGVTR
jgi:RNA polymerase sigma factor (sigma-70 family)